MRRRTFVLLTALASLMTLTAAAPASAGTFCYDLNVTVQGSALIAESGCEELPV
jgi:type 1 fimbria pilin